MKEYNKEKLQEYAKELFALCLEKGLDFEYNNNTKSIYVMQVYEDNSHYVIGTTYICSKCFKGVYGSKPIWELIEKVKQYENKTTKLRKVLFKW